ncbi:MAG: hypothetical protein ACRD68_06405, partial [Pyrinomonadaceae bacterium]
IPVPPVPAVPDIPPPPVPPSTGGAEGVANSSLVYPGAETMMNITQEDGGGMLQLRTTDPFEKVFDWYVAKIKPTKTIRTPGFTSTAILRAEGVTAIITAAGGDQTTIMIKQEADQ